MKFKDRMRQMYYENKGLVITAIILNIVFTIVTILSLCGVNIAQFSCNNSFLMNINNWLYAHHLHLFVASLMFASNNYFMIAICSNDYTVKPLIYSICLLPVYMFLQYTVGINLLLISCLTPICVTMAYSFKFSTLWKSIVFSIITVVYQYLMQITKLKIFGISYLSVDLLTYILLSIDLYIVLIFAFCIFKTLYKNKLKRREIK